MGRFCGLSFNPTTTGGPDNSANNLIHEERRGLEQDTGPRHVHEQGFAGAVDVLDVVEVDDGAASGGRGGGGGPALTQLADPGAGQLAFEAEAELAGTVEERDLEHRYAVRHAFCHL
jgi:hypothetical protein